MSLRVVTTVLEEVVTRRSRWYTEETWAHLLYLTSSHTSIYVKNWESMRTIRTHSLLSIRVMHRTIAIARLYQQFIQRLRDTSQFKSRIELLNTIALYLLIVHISLSSHISLFNEWQSLSKRTQSLRYNHEHHECKENVFHLWIENRIETSLYRISSMKSRAKTMRHNQTAQTLIKSLLERHALNRSYRFITDNIVSNLLFRRREVIV